MKLIIQNKTKSWTHFSKRQLTNFLDLVLNNLFIITKKFKLANNETLPKSFCHDWQLQLALDFFKKKKLPCPILDKRPLSEIQNLIRQNTPLKKRKTKSAPSSQNSSLSETPSIPSSPLVLISQNFHVRHVCSFCRKGREKKPKRTLLGCVYCKEPVCIDHQVNYLRSVLYQNCAPN